MESGRFDALTRALGIPGSRRRALTSLLSSAFGLLVADPGASDEASAKKRHKRDRRRNDRDVRSEGPCGNGKPKKNRCRKNRHCCTNYCKKGKGRKRTGRCRCRKAGQSCTEDRNCCPERTGRTCIDGACRTCDVCASGCPFTRIQNAIEAADDGATIRLCAETYREIITITKSVTLLGVGEGPDGTILDGQRVGTVVFVESGVTAVHLQGLRITGGNAVEGGGLVNLGELTLTACSLTDNESELFGGGIGNGGRVALNDCTLTSNTAVNGGGIVNSEGEATLTNCIVDGNTAVEGGGIYSVFGGEVALTDSTVSGNSARGGFARGAASTPKKA